MIDRRHFASGEGRESRFSFSCLHWDHEPTPNPSQEGNFRAADECLLPSWEGSGVGQFMERMIKMPMPFGTCLLAKNADEHL